MFPCFGGAWCRGGELRAWRPLLYPWGRSSSDLSTRCWPGWGAGSHPRGSDCFWGSQLQTRFVGCRVRWRVGSWGAGRRERPLAQGLTTGCNFISWLFAFSSPFFQPSWKSERLGKRGSAGNTGLGFRSGGLRPPNPPSLRPQPRIVQSPPLCPGWGFICMTRSGAWRGGLALGFLGPIPAAFPSKWAPSRRRSSCQSNSLLWNREMKISSVFFRRGQGRSGNPADPTVFPFNPPLPLFPLRMSRAAARARTSQTEAEKHARGT